MVNMKNQISILEMLYHLLKKTLFHYFKQSTHNINWLPSFRNDWFFVKFLYRRQKITNAICYNYRECIKTDLLSWMYYEYENMRGKGVYPTSPTDCQSGVLPLHYDTKVQTPCTIAKHVHTQDQIWGLMMSLEYDPPVYSHTYTTAAFVCQILYLDEYPAN